jgi:hypothetical protein
MLPMTEKPHPAVEYPRAKVGSGKGRRAALEHDPGERRRLSR